MRAALLLGLTALLSCALPHYNPAGKQCDATHPCPEGLACVVGLCGGACKGPPVACSGPERPCIVTLAGIDGPGFVDGPPNTARFRSPSGLLALPEGALIVADTGNHALRKVPLDGGVVTTIAGDGHCMDTDPNALCEPHGLALGVSGELFVTALGVNSVVRVENGAVRRLIGTGLPNTLVRPTWVVMVANHLAVANTNSCEVRFYELDGKPVTSSTGQPVTVGGCAKLDGFQLGYMEVVAASRDGKTLYFGDGSIFWSVPLTNGLPSGPARHFAGQGTGFLDGAPEVALFADTTQAAVTADALILADSRNRRLRRLPLQGVVTTLAGTAYPGLNDGPAVGPSAAQLYAPAGVAVVGETVYFTSDHRVRKLENGRVTTVAGFAPARMEDGCAENVALGSPGGVDVDPRDGTVYFTDTLHHAVRALGTNGTIVTLLGGTPGSHEGPFETARVNAPTAIKLRPDGGLVVADTGNGLIVQLDLSTRRLATLVGAPRLSGFQPLSCGSSLDNPPKTASLCGPRGLALAPSGELFFTDSPEPGEGVIGSLSADGAKVRQLTRMWFFPHGIAVLPSGNLIVTELARDVIAEYTPLGSPVRTILEGDGCDQGQHWERPCAPTDVVPVGNDLLILFQGSSTIARLQAGSATPRRLGGTPFVGGFNDGLFEPLLDAPSTFAAYGDGGIIFADSANRRLRVLWP